MIKKCRYCENNFQKDSEHVFPFGLGGEDLYMNCVCEQCNNDFSGLERELYQKSIIALLRSVEGIVGYNSSRNKPAPFKAPLLVAFDKENKIVYEVGQYHEMKIFIRPQIIEIQGEYFIEGDKKETIDAFCIKFTDWKNSNLRVITRLPKGKNDTVGYVEFENKTDHFVLQNLENKIKIKNEIVIVLLPQTHELYETLNPRLFIDDNNKLKIRAKSVNEAIDFINGLLKITLTNTQLHSFCKEIQNQPEIFVGLDFNPKKFERALVKIGLNCLIYYFPKTINESALDDFISFVKIGSPSINASLINKSGIIDYYEKTHNIFFTKVNIR